MAYLLTILAGLALLTAIYHTVLFWQKEQTPLRVSTAVVWFSGFYTCIVIILELGRGWEVSGFIVLIGALLVANVFAWRNISQYMLHDKPSVAPPPPPQTLVEMTHADQPGVIEATEKK